MSGSQGMLPKKLPLSKIPSAKNSCGNFLNDPLHNKRSPQQLLYWIICPYLQNHSPSACSARPRLPDRVPKSQSCSNCPVLLNRWMRLSARPLLLIRPLCPLPLRSGGNQRPAKLPTHRDCFAENEQNWSYASQDNFPFQPKFPNFYRTKVWSTSAFVGPVYLPCVFENVKTTHKYQLLETSWGWAKIS